MMAAAFHDHFYTFCGCDMKQQSICPSFIVADFHNMSLLLPFSERAFNELTYVGKHIEDQHASDFNQEFAEKADGSLFQLRLQFLHFNNRVKVTRLLLL